MKILAILTSSVFIILAIFRLAQNEEPSEALTPLESAISKSETPKPKKLKPVKKFPDLRKNRKVKSDSRIQSIQLKKIVNIPTQKEDSRPQVTNYDFKDFVYVDEQENLYVESVIVDGEDAVSFGDVLIGSAKDIFSKAEKGESVSINHPVPWTDGIVPYVIDEKLKDSKGMIQEAMGYIEEGSGGGLKFVQRKEQENYLSFKKGNEHCYSYVGMKGGEQKVSLSLNCGVHEIMHELMHAIGFFHEQNREDRDQFIEVHFYNIDEKYHPQFKKIPNSWQHLFNTDFDFKSIMLYPPTAFSMYEGGYSMTTVEGDPYTLEFETLSELDKWRINQLYPPK